MKTLLPLLMLLALSPLVLFREKCFRNITPALQALFYLGFFLFFLIIALAGYKQINVWVLAASLVPLIALLRVVITEHPFGRRYSKENKCESVES